MREKRSGLAPIERARAVAAAVANLAALPELRAAVERRGFVAGFVAMWGELDPVACLNDARSRGARVVLPRVSRLDDTPTVGGGTVEGGDANADADADAGPAIESPVVEPDAVRAPTGPRLRFHEVSPSDLLVGAFGIDEPPAAAPEVAPGVVDVMVVPGLAFDASGARLGYGGGYYDELLRSPGDRPAFVVGFGHDFQVVDACPVGERDARIDCVVTDARVIRCDASVADGGRGRGEPT